jgi:hypothetical protein
VDALVQRMLMQARHDPRVLQACGELFVGNDGHGTPSSGAILRHIVPLRAGRGKRGDSQQALSEHSYYTNEPAHGD